MEFRAQILTRRGFAASALAAAAALPLGTRPALAELAEPAKAAAWRLGDRLSLAALLYAQGGQDDQVERFLSSIKTLAEALEIAIAPFPPRAATAAETYANAIHYLIKGDGAEIGRALSRKFGNDAGLLYEVAIKSNLLLLLYEPGDDQGIGGVIKSRMSEIGLPETLWMGVVNAIDKKASQGELKDAIFKMHDEVASYLGAKGE